MVKNTKGGNKTKKQARKNNIPDMSTVKTRYSTDPDEIYACCSKLLGNGMCRVLCIDGIERICIIRNKFRGRGRRGNILEMGTWCLVGKREFESSKEGKLDKTDLLEVYNEMEKKQIVQKEIQYKEKWKIFSSLSTPHNYTGHDEEAISFHRETELPPEQSSGTEDEEDNIDNSTVEKYNAEDLGEDIDINDI